MKRNRLLSIVNILVLCIAVQAQQPISQSRSQDKPADVGEEIASTLLARAESNSRKGFRLMPSNRATNASGSTFSITPMAAGPNLTVMGGGTWGRLTKWTGFTSSNSFIGNSTIFEDKYGMVGIGTETPTSRLTVAGTIESTSGGVKFPDGSVQTTAGIAPTDVVRSLNGLKGDVQLAAGSNITITPTGNTLTIASIVQDPARSAFQATLSARWETGVFTDTQQITVPAGKRLVIEYLTTQVVPGFNSAVNFLRLTTTVNSVSVTHSIFPTKGSSTPGIFSQHTLVRIYADGGTNVVFFASRDTAPGSGEAILTISGYLVDIP